MLDRYFSPEPITSTTATLSGSEAHHLLHVMRAKPGLRLTVFDGLGGEYEAEVTRCGRSDVELAVGNKQEIERELSFQLTLAVALPKGDRQRWLIEKAVELGVTRIVPLQTARSVVEKKSASSKLERYIIEASKQCGRNRLMLLETPMKLAELLGQDSAGTRLFLHPGGAALSDLQELPTDDCTVAIGPEGGFTEDEASEAVAAGWKSVGLGSRILRIETAAIAIASALALR